ncbi:protein SOB FIVE-LIKE 4-like [Nicotiana tabacum]|uniref:Protein SOB FIVE-LIKE 4-like n=3 Tax=Nicotiana TaxID=4085 RepID=A0A1S3YWL2_TOBAC|nr:PREDICTED: uncharacterized protein LOC104241510 isoform X1 [Nicotiana sylvestris]XP_016456539.1 PREDICTED: uncharacterized protein LOC107780503 [Nicotiana tabacum]
MDYSKFFGEAEECNSSESGWTMYIGSPSNGEDDDELENEDFDELEDNNKEVINRDDNEDGDTDDSMASDASSGPSLRQYITKNGKGAGLANMVHYKNPKEKGKDYKVCGLNNNDPMKFHKANNSVKSGSKNEVKEEESVFAAKGEPSNGGNKVRKSIWMGKGK